jgi:uncharacterized phage-associated protein
MPEAWVNGPVYRQIYDKLKDLGVYNNLGLIETYKKNLDEEFEKVRAGLNLDDEQWDFLNAIFKHYGVMSHEKLVFMTHNEDPWNMARAGLGAFDYSNNVITHEMMLQYYKNRLESKYVINEI